MRPLIEEFDHDLSPEGLAACIEGMDCPILLRSCGSASGQNRHSFLAAFPMLNFVSHGARCEWKGADAEGCVVQFGNPWQLLRARISRYELLNEPDASFPTGGCFGFWGYDLGKFVEPRVPRTALNDLEFADCRVGFYPSLLVWDHALSRAWIVATGLQLDGTRCDRAAFRQRDKWREILGAGSDSPLVSPMTNLIRPAKGSSVSLPDAAFLRAVHHALGYIRMGDIYQVNLSRRWSMESSVHPFELFNKLFQISPAPFSAFQRWDDGAIVSSSPEQFLQISGDHIVSRPIKGTRPRSLDPDEDARLSYELQASEKERAELVMITDLLRNDLGRVCEHGSVNVPELLRLEKFTHVHHLVSTVAGRLRRGTTHLDALAACFPGGSITGAPKIRAMQIIDELEPVSRGPYTGSLGYVGFNRESQWNILIRSAFLQGGRVHYHAGAGIVADSLPEAELEETVVKARAFFQAVDRSSCSDHATPRGIPTTPFADR